MHFQKSDGIIRLPFFLCIFAVFSTVAFSQSAQDCLVCHGDPTLSMTKGGQTVSLHVDEARLKDSIHSSMACVDCHQGFDPGKFPHAKVIKPVQCRTCHEIQGFEKSIHAMGGDTPIAGCASCHGSHDILSVNDPKSAVGRTKVSNTCGKCHEDELKQFAATAHGGILASQGESISDLCRLPRGAHNRSRAGTGISGIQSKRSGALPEVSPE